MSDSSPVSNYLGHRPPSVAFIDNRLPEHHQLFADPSVRYDPVSEIYVPSRIQEDDQVAMASRPVFTDIKAMRFWESILPRAMSELHSTPEPKGRSESPYSIRNKTNWHAIFSSLEEAKYRYENREGPMNKLRDMRRKAANKAGPVGSVVGIVSKVIPEGTLATPVLGALQILLGVRWTKRQASSGDAGLDIITDETRIRQSRLLQTYVKRFLEVSMIIWPSFRMSSYSWELFPTMRTL
jgi:hypothetical protein